MSTPLLNTKLYIPPARPRERVVPRPRLIERLNEGLDIGHKLTLVSAPAGFGKTTLVSEWVNQRISETARERARPIAWLSLDEGDNDLTRFLTYLVAALQTIVAGFGDGVLGMLQSPQPTPSEPILTALINDIIAIPDNFVLVLDDYHVIDAKPVGNALTFTLEHMPPQLHLVIATREDPNLPLARLRARSQLTELRATDLRFMPSEAAEFLNQVMGLDLSAEEVTSLENRTEGWIAGLQLAALALQGLALQGTVSMQRREDVAGFVRAFAGDNRYIVDYLVEEVLQRQPERVRSFLLQTSTLDRLYGPLCDAVRFGSTQSPTGQDSKTMLEALERGNLFVVPLDDKRQWYRYHHLFADVLRARAMQELSNQIPTIHRRASVWYEQNGLPADAIRHALAAGDYARAAGLVELVWPAMEASYQFTTWLGWVKALPDELVRARPVLSLCYGKALLYVGELEAGAARVRDAERWLDTMAGTRERPEALPTEIRPARSRRMVVVDEAQLRSLPVSIATAHAYLAQARGDVSETIKYAQQALDLLPEGDFGRISATTYLGLAHWANGDLEAAYQALAGSMSGMQAAGHIADASGLTICLVDIRVAQGRLHEATGIYEQALQLASEQGAPAVRGTADLHLGLSMLHHERGDVETAKLHLLRSEELGKQAAFPFWPYRWCLALARLKETQADLDGALDLLHEAERHYFRNLFPDIRSISALKTCVWIRQGRLTEALRWARERGLSVDDDLSYLREFEHVTLARIRIAEYQSDRVERSIHEAMGLLERLLKAAEEGERTGSVIEILVLQALAHEAQGDIPSAITPLQRALTLAEPEGYVRIFVDEGPPMAALLREAAKHGTAPNYVSRLRAAFGKAEGSRPSSQPLIEPLSERELQVLQLIAQGLSNREIGERLFLALNTVKGHNRKIFGKLEVQRRTEAVARARELGLL